MLRGGAEEGEGCDGVDFGAIADVDRRFRGVWFVVGFRDAVGLGGANVGVDRALSGLGVLLPLVTGALELLVEGEGLSLWESDCERDRNATSETFFFLS